MVYTRKRPHRHHRRRYQRPHSKRWWRIQWRGRRRYHPRYQVIKTRRPKKTQTIYIRGFEPCSINGVYFSWNGSSGWDVGHAVKNNWQTTWFENYSKGQETQMKYSDFVGGWGMATFSLQDLNTRCKYGYAQSSHQFTDWDQVRWLKATFYPVKLQFLDWVIYFDTHFSAGQADYDNRKSWGNPLHLMLKPGKVLVETYIRKPGVFKKKTVRPPATLENVWFNKAFFDKVKLVSYIFSSVMLNNPIGIPTEAQSYNANFENKWFNEKCPKWYNRKEWDKDFTDQNNKQSTLSTWLSSWWSKTLSSLINGGKKGKQAPFCPPLYPSKELELMYFFYNFKFQVSGSTFQAKFPGTTDKEIDPPTTCDGRECRTCIRPDDLNSSGDISSEKFRELAESSDNNGLENSEEEDSEEDSEGETFEQGEKGLKLFKTWLQGHFTSLQSL